MYGQYLFCLVSGAISLSAIVNHAHAAVFMDIDAIGVLLSKDSISAQRTYTGTFDISAANSVGTVTIGAPYADSSVFYTGVTGYQSSSYVITSATAYFYIRDDASDSDTEEVRISFLQSASDGGSGSDFEFARGRVANRDFTVFYGALNSTLTGALQDGVIEYNLRTDRGDFVLDFARLEVVASPGAGLDATAVPEPGAVTGCVSTILLVMAAVRSRHRVVSPD